MLSENRIETEVEAPIGAEETWRLNGAVKERVGAEGVEGVMTVKCGANTVGTPRYEAGRQ